MNKFNKMLDKKAKDMPKLSDVEKDAKTHVLQAMREMAADKMNNKLDGMKKLVVEANSDKGLKEGVDKAKEIMDAKEQSPSEEMHEHSDQMIDQMQGQPGAHDEEKDEDPAEEAGESPEEEAAEGDDEESPDHEASESSDEEMSEDDLNAKLEKLMAMKKRLDSKKAR